MASNSTTLPSVPSVAQLKTYDRGLGYVILATHLPPASDEGHRVNVPSAVGEKPATGRAIWSLFAGLRKKGNEKPAAVAVPNQTAIEFF